MNIKDIRKANLISLIGNPNERGAVAQFSARFNLNPAQVGHVVNGIRTIGEKLARKFEVAIGLEVGALDKPPGQSVEDEAANFQAARIGPDAILLLEKFRAADPVLRAAALRILETELGQNKTSNRQKN